MNNNKQPKTKITVTTLGCKVNRFESESIRAEISKLEIMNGTDRPPMDIRIINTCTVTQKAAMQSRQAIRKAVRENPDAVILATGCYAQSESSELEKIDGLDYIIGNSDKHRIAQILSASDKIQKQSSPVILHHDIRNQKDIPKTLGPLIENRTRPFIKIQDGCDNFCSYCIVPYTRGPSRSLDPVEVVNIITGLPPEKRNEIVLSGIHLGKYGQDLAPPFSLLQLLQRIHLSNSVRRIRLSSIDPMEISNDLLEFTAASNRICHHFHIPLQSGDEEILKSMNRRYGPKQFEQLITKIRNILPEAAIGIDIMVGFPGETKQAFNNTYAFLKSLPVSYFHVFPFSARPGTKAFALPDHVDPRIIKKRRDQLLDLGRTKKKTFYTRMIGNSLDVLIEEKRDTQSGRLSGFSSNYVRVMIDGDNHLKNKILSCRIVKTVSPNAVLGELNQP